MKYLFSILFIILLTSCQSLSPLTPPANNTDYKNIIGKPIRIGNLEIAQYDFPSDLNWDESNAACLALGDGWRLPSFDELKFLYQNRVAIGMNQYRYWSSLMSPDSPKYLSDGRTYNFGWVLIFEGEGYPYRDGGLVTNGESPKIYTRAVRIQQ